MKKTVKLVWTGVLILAMFCLGILIADKQYLRKNLVRLHVVAASDSDWDQYVKLQVRDAVTHTLQEKMQHISDPNLAKQFLKSELPNIRNTAQKVLEVNGCREPVTVTLKKEPFDTRQYDTFSLPAGVYESLRIQIGNGAGANWWCVVFPSLCMPATTQEFCETAAVSGMQPGLRNALAEDREYEIRFFLLDWFGKFENLFHAD